MVVAWLRRKAVRLGKKRAPRDEQPQYAERVVSAGELAENNGQNGRPCWVAHGGAVYDVGAFLESHPGGASAIGEHGGRPIDAVFDAEHVHSSFARRVLEEHRVGVLGAPGGGERRSRLSFFRLASTTDLPGTKHAPPETLALGTAPAIDVRSRREDAAAMAAQAADAAPASSFIIAASKRSRTRSRCSSVSASVCTSPDASCANARNAAVLSSSRHCSSARPSQPPADDGRAAGCAPSCVAARVPNADTLA